MGRNWKSTFVTIAVIVMLVAAQAAAISYLGRNNYLPEGSEHWTEDWLIHYFSPRLSAPHKNIALVMVDAVSLEQAGLPSQPPADRAWLGKLITAVSNAGALAIGVDFYFKTPTTPAKDDALAAAIRTAKAPIVLAAVDDDFLQTDAQRKYLKDFLKWTKRGGGHIYLQRSKEVFSLGDRATRAVDHGVTAQGYPSLTAALVGLPEVTAVLGPHAIPEGQQRIDWLLEPENDETFYRYSAHEIVSPKPGTHAPSLKNKIVLIGPDFAGLDQHTLPYSSIGKAEGLVLPGVFVHAHALAQLLDGRFFFNWTFWQQTGLLFIIGLAGAAAGWPFHGMRADFLIGIGGSLLIIALSIPLFQARMPLPIALAILSWGTSIWLGERVQNWRK